MRNLTNQYLTHWINFWVFVFCVAILAIGRGGEAAIILLLTMVYIFFTNKDDRSKYKLSRDEIIFVTLVILFSVIKSFKYIISTRGFGV